MNNLNALGPCNLIKIDHSMLGSCNDRSEHLTDYRTTDTEYTPKNLQICLIYLFYLCIW